MESNLGKARDQDSYGRNGISWSQHMSRWFSLRTYELEWCVCSDGSLFEWEEGGGVYIASTQNPTVTQFSNLGGTESINSVGPKM